MKALLSKLWVTLFLILPSAYAAAGEIEVRLSGEEEVPPVETEATGHGVIVIGDDRSVSGGVTVSGLKGIAAHIHVAPRGENGPPIITLVNRSGNEWAVPPGSTLSEEQFQNLLDGKLYVNVHTEAFKPGEIRGQLEPSSAPAGADQ